MYKKYNDLDGDDNSIEGLEIIFSIYYAIS